MTKEYRIVSKRGEDKEVYTKITLDGTPIDPKSFIREYQEIIEMHGRVIKTTNLEEITTFFAF